MYVFSISIILVIPRERGPPLETTMLILSWTIDVWIQTESGYDTFRTSFLIRSILGKSHRHTYTNTHAHTQTCMLILTTHVRMYSCASIYINSIYYKFIIHHVCVHTYAMWTASCAERITKEKTESFMSAVHHARDCDSLNVWVFACMRLIGMVSVRARSHVCTWKALPLSHIHVVSLAHSVSLLQKHMCRIDRCECYENWQPVSSSVRCSLTHRLAFIWNYFCRCAIRLHNS